MTFEASEDGQSGLFGIKRGTIQMTLDCPALQVEDTDAYYLEWCAKVNVLRGLKDEEWGARTFDLLDPSGNTIFVMGPVSGATQRGSD